MKRIIPSIQGVLNGVIGDNLACDNSSLAITMGFYTQGSALNLDAPLLEQSDHPLSNKLIVFVHGLTNTESIWNLPSDKPHAKTTDKSENDSYGLRLQSEQFYTPFYLRYNSGLPIKDNGLELSEQLEKLCSNYPLPIDELVLVGFSMGGLLVRYAQLDKGKNWLEHLTACAYIGTPHAGAPLERAGNAVSTKVASMSKDYFNAWHPWIELRSQGIKDLHKGLETSQQDFKEDIPHCFISGSLMDFDSQTDHLLYQLETKFLGDALVPKDSAQPRVKLKQKSSKHFKAVDHLSLAHHNDVYVFLAQWLKELSSVDDVHSVYPVPYARPLKPSSEKYHYAIDSLRLVCMLGHRVTLSAREMHFSISNEYYAPLQKIPLLNTIARPVEDTHKAIATGVFSILEKSFSLPSKLLPTNSRSLSEASRLTP